MEKEGGSAEDVAYWRELARYDLETAVAMFRSRRYLYVLFVCQQAIEKMLKALVVRVTGELPPRTHRLMRLADMARLPLSESQIDLLRRLSAFYIESRYPSDAVSLVTTLDRAAAQDYLQQTRELFRWLAAQLT